MKIAICAVAKQENDYVNDWIKYHLNLGVDKIFIYDNNDSTYEDVSTRIDEDVKSNVEIIPIHDTWSHQLYRYNQFYKIHKNEFDWIAFIDLDEFITLSKENSIKEFLSDPIFNDVLQVKLPWKNYGDGGLVERDMSIPIYESELTPSKKYTLLSTKAIVRGGADINCGSAHAFYMNKTNELAFGKLADGTIARDKTLADHFTERCYIRHYRTRTLVEYIKNKLNRGDGVYKDRIISDLNYYFEVNERTSTHDTFLRAKGLI